MGVIGRLDDQVNEIIIKPVGARREATQSEEPQTPALEPARQAHEEERAQNEGGARPVTSELPVWLL
jgi:hypothetical protein